VLLAEDGSAVVCKDNKNIDWDARIGKKRRTIEGVNEHLLNVHNAGYESLSGVDKAMDDEYGDWSGDEDDEGVYEDFYGSEPGEYDFVVGSGSESGGDD